MKVNVPEISLIVLVGVSGSGKSTFAAQHFKKTEIVSSDVCRGIVSDDENNQAATGDAFELLHYIVAKRLKNGLLTVVDATNVQPEARKSLVQLAREYHVLSVALVLDIPEKVCAERNAKRPDRNFGKHVLRQQRMQLRRSLRGLKREGFSQVVTFGSPEEAAAVEGIERQRLYNDRREVHGPFDIIGDIHGCYDELCELLVKLGYSMRQDEQSEYGVEVVAPEGRTAIFLGDLVDRGPKSPQVLKLVMHMVKAGSALCVPGNHDIKLQKKLAGKKVNLKHGLAETLEQLEAETPEFRERVNEFIYGLISHLVLDNGNLVVAHAGLKEEMQGRASGAVRSFCLFGETTGEIDEFGLPVRYNWAAEYRGSAKVVYGHTPVPNAQWLNRTIDIDTGCVFGGKLTALRYPEEELVSVPARTMYYEPAKPLTAAEASDERLSQQHEYDDVLDIDDVTGKRYIETRLHHNVTIREENSIAALEVMSRFAINPKWLIYLPPTMSPCETSDVSDALEHPEQAITYFADKGVQKIVCEEKHMGSRAIVIVCKNEEAVRRRFGLEHVGIGMCYTRTGRSFFTDGDLQTQFLAKLQAALTISKFWESFETDWVCLDCELMPWSVKAQSLLRDQYAAVGAAASAALPLAERMLQLAHARGIEGVGDVLERFGAKTNAIEKYKRAYGQYCWPVASIDDLKLAPFHILATEGRTHFGSDHVWHMRHIKRVCDADRDVLLATDHKIIDVQDNHSVQSAIQWWENLTAKGGEGMVVKPFDFIARDGKNDLLQPAVKCRGREYLRIIYGPDYDMPQNLERLKRRGLGRKRSLALREFALGVEGLERFIRGESLRAVHECVFGVLALESEDVDPRL